MKKILRVLSISILSLTILAGCNSEQSANQPLPAQTDAQTSQAIIISGFAFSPSNLEVVKGTTVTWTNQDQAPHSIISQDKTIASPLFNQGESFTFTFNSEGIYSYSCGIHPSMKGKITVKQ